MSFDDPTDPGPGSRDSGIDTDTDTSRDPSVDPGLDHGLDLGMEPEAAGGGVGRHEWRGR